MNEFVPDYNNILKSARNIEAERMPIYEHLVSIGKMEQVLGKNFVQLYWGDYEDKKEYFRNFCEFYRKMGYDTVSFEECIGPIMPHSGCLGAHKESVIKSRDDFERYPWDEIPELYFKAYSQNFSALREVMPEGMKAIGGVGNGVFECVQEVIGYMNLAYFSSDDEELYAEFFRKTGEISVQIWERFMREFGDIYCVLRFGDDLGYKSNTLLSASDIKAHIIPQYKKIISIVHSYNKPFLLHSCGCIFNVMEDLIGAGIDAKHSNEDQIAEFPVWVEKYGDRIGNFGGIDTDAVCRLNKKDMEEYIKEVVRKSKGHGGFAFGSGNSIPDYVPVENYLNMNEIIRKLRGEYV